jgi:hypothetical protein
MSVQKIIQEAINENPLGLKEALQEELRSRVALALEAKMNDEEDEDEDTDDDTEDDDEDEDMKEEAEQIDEISKGKLDAYMDKSHDEFKKIQQKGGRAAMTGKQSRRYDDHPYKDNPGNTAFKKLTGRARVNATESFDLSDYTVEELEAFMQSEEFEQLDELKKSTLASYVSKAADNAAMHGIKYGEKKAQSDEMDRMMNRHMSYADKDKVRQIMKTTSKDIDSPREKAAKRLKGIDLAVKKLSK